MLKFVTPPLSMAVATSAVNATLRSASGEVWS